MVAGPPLALVLTSPSPRSCSSPSRSCSSGRPAADYVARMTGLGPVFAWTWKILQWPVILALVSLGAGIVYYFAPDAEQEWVWVTPGSVLTTALWLLASLGFKYYSPTSGPTPRRMARSEA